MLITLEDSLKAKSMEHLTRKNIRLTEYDYSQNGSYFITICSHNKECIFGTISDETINLSPYGQIAFDEIIITNKKRESDNIAIEKFVIMPNHLHMIISINSNFSNAEKSNLFSKPIKNSIATIVGGYKPAVTRKINELESENLILPPKIWQPRFYEHVIRNEESHKEIWQYIENNIINWEQDRFYIL